jgi:uncharacterized protein YlxP (DUF503 family)
MKAGLLTLRYRLYAVTSIKTKRSIVKRILAEVDRGGTAFGACEADDQDDLRTMTIRVAHLSNDPTYSASVLDRLSERLDRGDGYQLIDAEVEIV